MHWLSPFLRKFSRGNNNRNSRSNWFSSEQGKVLLERTDSHLARKLIRKWFQCSDLEIGMAAGNQSSCLKLRCSCAKDTGDVKIQWPPKTSHSRDVRSTPHRSPMHSLYPSRTHKIKRSAPLAWSSLIEVFAEPLMVGMMRSSAPANIWAPKKLGASERKFIVCESIHARARLPHNRYSSIFLQYEIKRKNSYGFYQQYTFTNVYNFKYSKKIQNYSCVSRPPYNTYSLSPPLVL